MGYRIRNAISEKQNHEDDRSRENESVIGVGAGESTCGSEESCDQHADKKFGKVHERIIFKNVKPKSLVVAVDVRQVVGIQMKI